jgi:hypothetical protein
MLDTAQHVSFRIAFFYQPDQIKSVAILSKACAYRVLEQRDAGCQKVGIENSLCLDIVSSHHIACNKASGGHH